MRCEALLVEALLVFALHGFYGLSIPAEHRLAANRSGNYSQDTLC
jgi:hypothetical protein